ncbi:MAG TPA: NmrA family NAD(P)-binding protein [Povalibacter sp.]|jgi:uncharacterized protein YbjT (DUF2867 family)|nr:NmrA family NAD(P)-binding protein [Povalibacter sp.]
MLLVTGATGNVGQAVLAELADKPVAVRAFVRDPSRLRIAAPNIEVVRGDLTDDDSLHRALDGVDAAFLASGFSPRMAELHSRFVAAAKKANVARLVQLSGVGANSGLCCARALRWLGQVEGSTQSSGMQVTHLRPTFYMQNLLQFAPAVAEQNVIAGPFRSGKWTFVDARDVGAVGAAALLDPAHAGRTYTVTGSESISYEDVASRMSHVLGKTIRYVDITANEARGRLQAAGAAPVMIEATLELWDACASNLINVAPTRVVQEVTGREPRSFDDFLRDYRHAFV